MGDVVHVAVFDDVDHLREDLAGFLFSEAAHLGEPPKELASFAVTEWKGPYSSTMKTLSSSSKVS
jgi:hypothetical protein